VELHELFVVAAEHGGRRRGKRAARLAITPMRGAAGNRTQWTFRGRGRGSFANWRDRVIELRLETSEARRERSRTPAV
jgi:hypothetical protein